MSKVFGFGEVVDGYDVKVLNEREARAGAGILFLIGLISFINCITTKSILVTQIFIGVFLVEFMIRVLVNPKYAPVKFHHVVPFQKQYLETHLVKS